MFDPTLDKYTLAGTAAAYGVYASTVLVADWQVKQQVCNLADAECNHLLSQFRAYAMQVR
jgi:hypothetical protein